MQWIQSDQLTTKIPNYSPNNIRIGQENDNDYQDDREDYLHQVHGTMDIHTPAYPPTDDKDTEQDNNTCKRQRKIYSPADISRKELTKQRQAQMLKKQQEKQRLKAKTLENTDNVDTGNRDRTRRPTTPPDYNGAI